jgi:hypothetical protein
LKNCKQLYKKESVPEGLVTPRKLFAKKINKSKVRTNKAEMKQFASHSEDDITAKR